MIRRYAALYITALTIPVLLGLTVWQSNRYRDLQKEVNRLEETQADQVEGNKRLIAGIAALSSPERIEYIAVNELGLHKIEPEKVLQIRVEGWKGHDL